ncbi:hypothetical protein O181_002352 [Austropuccinia psidii MF-1]|uniref:Integrase catalytic domain-containing protein n=1 Tax=Austropuccinia psidii MF-1 TaxID=1389203 RepID=A0A9Q3BCA8_9BASI|nr:hypothetical protein [Austropuccinia psidii MF-1]
MIQTLEDMIRRFCAYGLEFKHSDGFTHYWCTLILALELEYKTSVHSSTGQTPSILEGGWNPRLPEDTLRRDLIVLVSTLNFNKIKGPKKLKASHVGPFVIFASHGNNAVQVKLSTELENKHPTVPVSLRKPYQPAEKDWFPLRNPTPLSVPPVEQSEHKKIKKGDLGGKPKQYPVRYRNPVHEDKWLAESEIPDSDKLLRRRRHERIPQA